MVQLISRRGVIREIEYTSPNARYLVLIRIEGSLVLWGVYPPVDPRVIYKNLPVLPDCVSLSWEPAPAGLRADTKSIAFLQINASRLDSVFADIPSDQALEYWAQRADTKPFNFLTLNEGRVSFRDPWATLEIYACLDTDVERLPPTRKGDVWYGFFSVRFARPSTSDYEMSCQAQGSFHFVARKPQRPPGSWFIRPSYFRLSLTKAATLVGRILKELQLAWISIPKLLFS